ncbi:hypothetical protein CYMTET_34050, partial [Cymbomonas tetramitiformis]|eukprot:gene18664-22284_t
MSKEKKIHISIVTLGHVWSGKSTTAGHLLYKLGGVSQDFLNQCEEEVHTLPGNSKYTWVLDRLEEERLRGNTVNTTLRNFETTKYNFTLIDAPGHRRFINNAIRGISQAEVAILVLDCRSHCFEAGLVKDGQTREHAFIAYALGVKQIICVLNKMDATKPAYSKWRYHEIVKSAGNFLRRVGFPPTKVTFIPLCAISGENISKLSPNMDWYKGSTLVEALDALTPPKRTPDKPLRVPISGVHAVEGVGTVVVGRVASGVLRPGASVAFTPGGSAGGITAEVLSIEMHHQGLSEAGPGDHVGFA